MTGQRPHGSLDRGVRAPRQQSGNLSPQRRTVEQKFGNVLAFALHRLDPSGPGRRVRAELQLHQMLDDDRDAAAKLAPVLLGKPLDLLSQIRPVQAVKPDHLA